MKNKLAAFIVLPVIGLGIVGAGVASAHGWFGLGSTQTPQQVATTQETWFQKVAQALGISEADVKAAWAQGETIQQLMKDKGIKVSDVQAELKDMRLQQIKDDLAAMVSAGVINQAQADQRLQFMQSQNNGGNGVRGFGFGIGSMMGRGHMGWGF